MTTTTKHTAGKWRVVGGSDEKFIYGPKYKNGDSCYVAALSDIVERDDNARLIAAAPELLEALQELTAWYDANLNGVPTEYGKMMERAEEAIAKAVKP